MRQLLSVRLPVLSVERFDDERLRLGIQAPNIHIVAVGIGAGDVERFDAARPAEFVLCNAGVELIRSDVLFALQQFELRLGDNQMKVTGLRAHRAVAVTALDPLGRFDLELHRSAMTTAAIDHGDLSSKEIPMPCIPDPPQRSGVVGRSMPRPWVVGAEIPQMALEI